jgi:hypothetical protein
LRDRDFESRPAAGSSLRIVPAVVFCGGTFDAVGACGARGVTAGDPSEGIALEAEASERPRGSLPRSVI